MSAATLAFAATLLTLCCVAQDRAPQATPATARALAEHGLQLMNTGHLAEAQLLLAQAHAQAPADLRITTNLAKLDAVLGRTDAAVQLFREIEAVSPADSANQLNLAIALATQGSLPQALTAAESAVKLAPGSAAAHHLRAKILADLERPREAQEEYRIALSLAPHDPQTLYDDALLLESQSEWPEEIRLLRQLVQLRPQVAEDHFLLGRALARNGDSAGAILQYREAVRLDPSNRSALYSLSRALQPVDPAEAARVADRFRALRLSEDELNRIRTDGNRGVAAMQRKDWPAAIFIFQGALSACAGCSLEATLEKDLGLSQCQNGDLENGAASLRRSLALNPNDLDTVKALELAGRSRSPAK